MISLWHWFWYGHAPRWKIISDVKLTIGDMAAGRRYVLQCDGCGNIKQKDII